MLHNCIKVENMPTDGPYCPILYYIVNIWPGKAVQLEKYAQISSQPHQKGQL